MLSLSFLACIIIVSESVYIPHIPQHDSKSQQSSLESIFRVRRTYIDANQNCGPQDLEMVHAIMERICILCHELRSHFAPNTRVECRSDCFQNDTFQSCMKIFSGVRAKTVRNSVEPTAPVPLYTEESQTLDDIKENRRM